MENAMHQSDAGERSSLAKEIAFYEANKEMLIKEHINRHLLIKGNKLIGSYQTEEQAIAEGITRFGVGPFLVRLTGEDTPVVSVPALTLGIPLCQS